MIATVNLILFLIAIVLVMMCGYCQEKTFDKYAITTVILMIIQGLFVIFVLSFEYRFDILSLTLGLELWVHHAMIHRSTDFGDQITFLTFQLKDCSNHETWIVACFTAALVWLCSAC